MSLAEVQWGRQADALVRNHPEYQSAQAELASCLADVHEAVDAYNDVVHDAEESLADIEPPEIEVPQAEIEAEAPEAPEPLFTTDDDFPTASRKLVRRKKLIEDYRGED